MTGQTGMLLASGWLCWTVQLLASYPKLPTYNTIIRTLGCRRQLHDRVGRSLLWVRHTQVGHTLLSVFAYPGLHFAWVEYLTTGGGLGILYSRVPGDCSRHGFRVQKLPRVRGDLYPGLSVSSRILHLCSVNVEMSRHYEHSSIGSSKGTASNGNHSDSKNFGKWMGSIWTAQLGESLVMPIGPSGAPKFIALLGTKFRAH